ncbi:MAG: response regulator [Polyangiaceae bacterium]|nr:response regulator [Polyangiaceae bacterium]
MVAPNGESTRAELEQRLAIAEARVKELESSGGVSGGADARPTAPLSPQARQGQRLESLGVLAGAFAHDMNNLLCGILGGVELAMDELDGDHPARADLAIVQRTAREATELCRQLLSCAGRGRVVVEPIDVSELVASMRKILGVSAGKTVTVGLELGRDLPSVTVDASQLRQVIINLVANAADAIGSASGKITICTGFLTGDDACLGTTYLDGELRPGGYAFIEVADNGRGMDAVTIGRLFDSSFSTKSPGRGLGLAAVQGIVRAHSGAVEVHSQVGVGSTFKVLLPTSAEVATRKRSPGGSSGWSGRGLVLLVDDEPIVRSIGVRILQRLGFEVVTAEDGVQALEVFDRNRDRIELVLLDMNMPNLGGEATFRELRARDPNVRVVLTSGYDETEAISQFGAQGLAAFLQKPFQLATIRSLLERVFAR